jgi:iron complex outermembrane recepter protein
LAILFKNLDFQLADYFPSLVSFLEAFRRIFKILLSTSVMFGRIKLKTMYRGSILPGLILALLFASFSAVTYAGDKLYSFNVPEQLASAALNAFAQQAEHQVLYPFDRVEGIKTNALSGEYTAAEGIGVLLKDTGLKPVFSNDGVITIESDADTKVAEEGNDMKKERKLSLLAKVALFIFGITNVQGVVAEEEVVDEGVGSMLEEILVTGTASKTRTAMETSYGVDILTADEMDREMSLGITDLLDAVPGLWAESSGGEVNSNLSPRGTRGNFFRFISLQEDGLPNLYSAFLSEFEARYDLSYDRIETTLGGPSGVLTAQGAGAIVNMISRMPTELEGEARVSVTDYGDVRTDLFYGGPIPGFEGWTGTIGGYYKRGDGIKDQGFNGNKGGQLRANLKREFDNGAVTLSYKHIDAVTQFFSSTVVQTEGGKIRPVPGFNARDDSLAGPQTRRLRPKTPNGILEDKDLAGGSDGQTDSVSIKAEFELGNGFRVKEHARIAKIHHISQDLRGGANSGIMDAPTYVADQLAVLTAAFPTTASTQLVRVVDGTVITNPAAMNGNGLVAVQTQLLFEEEFDTLINDFQITHESDRNIATVGIQYWDINAFMSERDNTFLVDIKNQANTLNVQGLDATGAVVGNLTDNGVLTYGSTDVGGEVDTLSINLYFNDEFQVTDQLRLDGGVRIEYYESEGTAENLVANGALPAALNDPLVLADDVAANARNGTFTSGRKSLNDVAWTVGANYQFNDNLAVYARHAESFDNGFNNFGPFCVGAPVACFQGTSTELSFSEFGVRYRSDVLALYATGYFTKFKNASILTGLTNTEFFSVDNEALGLEFNAKWQPIDLASLEISGVIQDSKLVDDAPDAISLNGNQFDRLPNIQLRFTPTVYFDKGQAYATISHYGKRFGDIANTQVLDAYTQVDAGAYYNLTDNITIAIQGNNLTNEFAISEGNARGNNINAGSASFGYARAILGRSFTATASYRF